MAPRTILYTGKGGVGKTSVAAATARRCAAAGQRTILLSTDPAGSLGDVLEQPVGAEPGQVAKQLWAQQVSAQDELERHWTAVQAWLGSMLIERGVERIAAEELTVPPGGDELFSLLRIRDHVREGRWDVIVVDCAPTGSSSTSASECAGSVESTTVRSPAAAQRRAVAAATDVLPTPPLPV